MAKIEYNGITLDSQEEVEFYQWCEEARKSGLISLFYYHPPSYTLSTKQTYTVPKKLKTKVRFDEKTLLRPHVYTADFMFFVNPGTDMDIFTNYDFIGCGGEILIDVKGGFSRFNDDKVFSINRKWLYEKHGVYVNKVIPEKLFLKTWVPEKVRYTPKTGKLRKKYLDCKTINQYMETI